MVSPYNNDLTLNEHLKGASSKTIVPKDQADTQRSYTNIYLH